jgi:hypothetical protein
VQREAEPDCGPADEHRVDRELDTRAAQRCLQHHQDEQGDRRPAPGPRPPQQDRHGHREHDVHRRRDDVDADGELRHHGELHPA